MRSLIIFIFVCIAGVCAVTGYTEDSIPKQSSEVIAEKRKACYFLSDAQFENIVDKPCIVYRGGGGSLWSIVFRDTDTLGVYYFDSEALEKKSES